MDLFPFLQARLSVVLDDDVPEVPACQGAVIMAGRRGIHTKVDERHITRVNRPVSRVPRHVDQSIGQERKHTALARGLVFQQHDTFTAEPDVKFRGFSPGVQVAPGQKVLIAHHSWMNDAKPIVKIAVTRGVLHGRHRVDQRISFREDALESIGIPEAAAQVCQVTFDEGSVSKRSDDRVESRE